MWNMPKNMNYYFDNLYQKYKNKGALFDSNLMIYYFIGSYFGKDFVERYKRTNIYGFKGFEVIYSIMSRFKSVITTPHILTEISNLSTPIPEKFKEQYFEHFFRKIKILDEKFFPAKEIGINLQTNKFGLTDSMILYLSQNQSYLVITSDLPLYNLLEHNKIDVINFNHIYQYLLN